MRLPTRENLRAAWHDLRFAIRNWRKTPQLVRYLWREWRSRGN